MIPAKINSIIRNLVILTLMDFLVAVSGCATTPKDRASATLRELRDRRVEVGCSMCVFGMEGSQDCLLAAKIDGRTYLVEGSGIDDHGDAHAPDGLCHIARDALATGHLEGDKLVVSKLSLLPPP